MKLTCTHCGIVEAVERRGMHVYWESGVESICLLDVPNSFCPHKNCDEWLGVSIKAIAWLHVTIATALWRKKNLTEKERIFLQKQPYIRGAMEGGPWRYKRRGQLIECYLLDGRPAPENDKSTPHNTPLDSQSIGAARQGGRE